MVLRNLLLVTLAIMMGFLAGGEQPVPMPSHMPAASVAGLLSPARFPEQATTQQQAPVVNAVLFWSQTCPYCHDVMEHVLVPLKRQYGEQFNVLLIELKTNEEREILRQIAAQYGIRGYGVPLLVIGDSVLIGAGQIPAALPDLIDVHLSSGGLGLPDIPGLERGIPFTLSGDDACTPGLDCTGSAVSAAEPAQPRAGGFALAAAIMAGLMIALAYAGATVFRHVRRLPTFQPPAWLTRLTPWLAIAGLGVAGYLAYIETQAIEAVCGPIGDCNAVQASPYAALFGALPVGVLGVMGYVAILTAWLWARLRRDGNARMAHGAILVMTGLGTLFSLYLTYLELFVIRAVCAWCLASAVIITLLMLVNITPALQETREPTFGLSPNPSCK